jgi:LDH2 family malate/lactate/ureidoglycolate dehydrogenase
MIGETPSPIRSHEAVAHAFIINALEAVNVSTADATDVADVLIAADVRGIESHGIARLDHFYVARIQHGVVNPRPNERVIRENATQTLYECDNGLGHPASKRAMNITIEKAKKSGIAWATVAHSNHYGIAAYYAMMALDHDLIGFSTTNSSQLVAPTFGREKTTGTNPLAYAIPSGSEPPFVLDMATSTVTYGRLEVAERKQKALLPGWAVDGRGVETLDPVIAKRQGALLPLGGFGTESGGHKGYGLGLLVEILCGVLSGSPFGNALKVPEDGMHGGHTAHCFGAISIEAVRDLTEFKADMDRELRTFRNSTPGPGQERVMVAGDPEREATERYRREGVPINEKVYEALDAMADRLGIAKLERFTIASS